MDERLTTGELSLEKEKSLKELSRKFWEESSEKIVINSNYGKSAAEVVRAVVADYSDLEVRVMSQMSPFDLPYFYLNDVPNIRSKKKRHKKKRLKKQLTYIGEFKGCTVTGYSESFAADMESFSAVAGRSLGSSAPLFSQFLFNPEEPVDESEVLCNYCDEELANCDCERCEECGGNVNLISDCSC